MCWSATKKTCSLVLGVQDRRLLPVQNWIPAAFFGMIDKVVEKFPSVKVVATTLREVHSTNRHSWGAVAWMDGKTLLLHPPASWMCMTGSVAGMDLLPAFFTVC